MRWLLHWVLSALCVLVVARIVPAIAVRGFFTALLAAGVIGLINSTLGALLRVLTFPLILLTLGLFGLVLNALLLKLAAALVPGFTVHGFWSALGGALLLSGLNVLVRGLVARAD